MLERSPVEVRNTPCVLPVTNAQTYRDVQVRQNNETGSAPSFRRWWSRVAKYLVRRSVCVATIVLMPMGPAGDDDAAVEESKMIFSTLP